MCYPGNYQISAYATLVTLSDSSLCYLGSCQTLALSDNSLCYTGALFQRAGGEARRGAADEEHPDGDEDSEVQHEAGDVTVTRQGLV